MMDAYTMGCCLGVGGIGETPRARNLRKMAKEARARGDFSMAAALDTKAVQADAPITEDVAKNAKLAAARDAADRAKAAPSKPYLPKTKARIATRTAAQQRKTSTKSLAAVIGVVAALGLGGWAISQRS